MKSITQRLKEIEEWKKNENKYKPYWSKHYEILETIQFNLYSKAINQKSIFNKYTDKCIKLCYEDLVLAPHMIEYWKKDAKIKKEPYKPINYGSHKVLIKLLEKQQRYEEAIKVCEYYINLGLINDGTKGGILARKEKIIKLLENKID